ncbi:hypothetical protein GCM10010302_55870 [Streptomyces polychromogenes]|uniref:Uncharacterized protein n=1 Tax=Streptomyces polychromogenes TaxID=67342 RepID=A0ABN0VLA6_9ACTN
MQRGQEPLGYVHELGDLSSTSWMDVRAPAGLLADGYCRPGSAFPGPYGLPRGPSGSRKGWSWTSRSQWRGPHRFSTGFPNTKAS